MEEKRFHGLCLFRVHWAASPAILPAATALEGLVRVIRVLRKKQTRQA
jgi:hypothetical protein